MGRFDREPTHRSPGRNEREGRQLYVGRNRDDRLNPEELRALRTVGAFRMVDAKDLPNAKADRLIDKGLMQRRTVYSRQGKPPMQIVTLTRAGLALVQLQRPAGDAQRYWARAVKPTEVAHDASIYPAYKTAAGEIEKNGGRVIRVVLDYEFKSAINSRMNKKDGPSASVRRKQLADEYSLPVVKERLALPDLRIEFEDAEGREQHKDIEITTEHYRGSRAAGKAMTGFQMVRAGGNTPRASVIDDHHLAFLQ